MYKMVLLEPEEILHHWVLLEPYVSSFLNHNGESTSFDIGQNAINGMNQVWTIHDHDEWLKGVVVTKIDDYPTGKVLHIIGLSGINFDDWKHLHNSVLEPFAHSHDCRAITAWGRKGWERTLKHLPGNHGEQYEAVHVIYEMKLQGD